MGMIKNYLLDLLHMCSDEQFGQDAVERAIASGFIQLIYDKQQDLRVTMGEPGKPGAGNYPEIVETYHRVVRRDYKCLLSAINARWKRPYERGQSHPKM